MWMQSESSHRAQDTFAPGLDPNMKSPAQFAEVSITPEGEPMVCADARGRASFMTLTRFSRALTLTIAIMFAVVATGCVNSEIAAGRADLAKGNFAAAHEKFVAAAKSGKLSSSDQRELADGLCLTEFKLGPPEYSRAEQRETCALAAAHPGTSSAPIVTSIDAVERADTEAAVHRALTDDDFAEAEGAVIHYQTFPGADQRAIGGWSKQIWGTIEQDEKRSKNQNRHLQPAIAAISERYPTIRAMNEVEFKRWIMTNATVSDIRLVDRIDLRRHTLELQVASRNLPDIAFNLDHFIRINDAMVARCRCAGRTNIAVEGSGLPVYLVRVDPDTRNSAALVMPQPH
jgi:hypothetical protein